MNTFPSRKTDTGWILCPSKSFPGKFYYFNVTTGETAWCLNETEKKSLKNPPLQRVDHGYPEPNSPPTEEIQPGSDYQRTIQFSQNHDRSIPYYLKKNHRPPQNISNLSVQPFNRLRTGSEPKLVPCQIQLPMIWPNEGTIPQIVMIVMNQSMNRLALDEPEQGFRQQNDFEPNQVPEPNRAWGEPNQASEPNQAWQEVNHYLEPKQAWNEPNQVLREPREPDRELFVQSGKAPLCERFINFQKPDLEIKDNQIYPNRNDFHTTNQFDLSDENQINLSPKKACVSRFSYNQSIENPELSKLNQYQQKTLPCENREKFKNSSLNIAEKNPEKIENFNIFMQSPNNYQNSIRNVAKLDQGLLKQSQTKQFFGQIQTKQLFGESRKNQGHIGQSHANKNLYGQTQTKSLFGQSRTNNEVFGQGQSKYNPIGQSQTNKNPFMSNKTSTEISQSSLKSNPFQKLIAEKSTLKQSTKVDFSKSPQIKVELPPCFQEKHETNAEEKSALTLNNKAEIPQEADLQNLDKNDLRRMLMQKKRKSNVLATTDTVEAKKIKANMMRITTVATPKKKVTFNLEPECFSGSDNGEDTYKEMEYQGLSPPSNEDWYVITDATTLLEYFEVLDNFVKSDPKCNLLIPSGVMSDIVALSRGECRERDIVTLARHLLRALAIPQPHIIVQQSAGVSPDITTDDSILNCCLEMVDKTYVVLITNDEDLQTTAEYLNINCFTTDHIKIGQAKQAEVHFDVKKVKISITNNPDIEMPTRELESLSFKTDNLSLDQNNSSSNSQQMERDKTYSQPQPSTYSQKEKTKTEMSSIFKQTNDMPPIRQTQCSIFTQEKNRESRSQPSIFNKEKYENRQPKSKSLIFDKENRTNKEKQSILNKETFKNIDHQSMSSIFTSQNQMNSSIFETETKANQPKPICEIQNAADIKNKYLENFLKKFCEKNAAIEHLVEKRRDEICCTFKQIMEECLSNILQGKTEILHQKFGSSPPWTLTEALQCIVYVYDKHTYIRDVVAVFTSALNAQGDVTVTDVIKTVGCGVALVKYLNFISPTTEVVKGIEDGLNKILQNLSLEIDIEPKAPSIPHASHANENGPKRNFFVKDRSEVVKYLKKHFPAWAGYDETLEESTSEATWGKNYNNLKIVRTNGKNVGMLKLNNSKPMTIEPESPHEHKPKTNQNAQENVQNNISLENDRTQPKKMDVENITLNENLTKNKFLNLKVTRTVNNPTKPSQENVQNSVPIEENHINHTEPKVVRLFNNIDFKERENKAPEKRVLSDFITQGHTFDRTQNGPKILRNVKPIKEFEEKIVKKPLDLDKMDYSDKSDDTNINCLSMSIENNDDSNKNIYLDTKNYRDAKNDRLDATNDSRNLSNNAKNNGNAINVERTSNNAYNVDLDEIFTTNDVTHSAYYNNFDTDITSNMIISEKNDNYVTDVTNDGFKRLDHVNFELNDVANDMMQKDDATNDSGFENASQQAYYVMDTFLAELKVAFKAMHVFLENSVSELRRDELSASTHRTIRDTAKKTHANLDKIIENLGGIVHRETYTGPKLKELVAGAGSIPVDDRIYIYRGIVTKCYDHARLIDKAFKAILAIIDGREL